MTDRNINILLIEDDPADIRLVQHLLGEVKDIRFYFSFVGNLAVGLKRIKEMEADVILLDLTLPDGRGVQAIAGVHSQAPGIPILALNVVANEELETRAIREGAQDYLVKNQMTGPALKRSILYAMERKNVEKELARLASFAWQNKNPILETTLEGTMIYRNPAAEKLFPDLDVRGAEHPLLRDLVPLVQTLQKEHKEFIFRDIKIGDKWYEQHISFVPENKIIRSYIADMTERKQAEEGLRIRTEEIERMNRVMLGREMKIIELKEKIAQLEADLKKIKP